MPPKFVILISNSHYQEIMAQRRARTIDLGDLVENTTLSVQRALEARGLQKWPWGPIVIGIIMQPPTPEFLSKTEMAKMKG